MDPLSLLRECALKNRPTRLEGDRVVLGDASFPRTVETSWRALKGKKDRYRLDSVWLLLQHKDLEYSAYSKLATEQKIPLVSLVDKRELVSFLTGETSTNPAIDTSFDALVTPSSASQKHSIAPVDDRQSKRPKADAEIRAPSLDNRISTNIVDGKDANVIPQDTRRDIAAIERGLRSRISILECPTADFSKLTESFKAILRKEEMERKIAAQKQMQERKKAAVRHDVYEAADEKQLWKAKLQGTEAEELGIDTRGTFAAPASSAAPKAAEPAPRKPATPSARPSSNSHAQQKPRSAPEQPKQATRTPIIIVSSAPTAHITLYNVKQFLEDGAIAVAFVSTNPSEGIYVSSEERKNAGAKKESVVTVHRSRGKDTPPMTYEVIDNPARLTDKDWHRVVAVFALGAAWQFKGWYWTTPTDIFTHVKGFFVQFEDEQTPDLIKQWSVKVIKVSRSKRHLDATASLTFWQQLDEFVARNPRLHFLRAK